MRNPSKESFRLAKQKALDTGRPVIVGWHILQRLNSTAEISTPKHGRADKKSTRWYRKHYREAWVVMPDGTGFDVFDFAPPKPV